jgi:hypothetical protein
MWQWLLIFGEDAQEFSVTIWMDLIAFFPKSKKGSRKLWVLMVVDRKVWLNASTPMQLDYSAATSYTLRLF